MAEQSGVVDENARRQASQLRVDCMNQKGGTLGCWTGPDLSLPERGGEADLGVYVACAELLINTEESQGRIGGS